jgi:hypothetical protein
VFHGGQRSRTIAGQFFGDGEAGRGLGSSFGNILKFAFELKNMSRQVWEPTGTGLPEFVWCLLDNIDVIRSDRWQNEVGTHFDLGEVAPILNRLTDAASDLAKGVLTNREYYGQMKQIVRVLRIPQHFLEPRFRD